MYVYEGRQRKAKQEQMLKIGVTLKVERTMKTRQKKIPATCSATHFRESTSSRQRPDTSLMSEHLLSVWPTFY